MTNRHALILAGGEGSRLRPLTTVVPKALLPVGDLPIIEILIRQLARSGFSEISIAVGRSGALIETYCGNGSRWGVGVDYLREGDPLGTAGCLGHFASADVDRLLVVNGDTLTDFDFGALHASHDSVDAMTLVVKRCDVGLRFGVAEVSPDERLVGYQEKPVLSYEAGTGVYVVSTRALRDHLPVPEAIDLPELLGRLVDAGEVIRVKRTDCYWLDVGYLEDLEAANDAWSERRDRFLPS